MSINQSVSSKKRKKGGLNDYRMLNNNNDVIIDSSVKDIQPLDAFDSQNEQSNNLLINSNNSNNNSSNKNTKTQRCLSKCFTLGPKCCCLWFVCLLFILLIILILLTFLVFVPQLAQSTTDQSTMSVLTMHLSNVTNNSVLMNVTMMLSNAGSFDAKISSALANGYFVSENSDELFVGTLQLPDITVKANEGATFQVIAPLNVQNTTNFKRFAESLLNGGDTSLLFKGKPSLTVQLLGMSINANVNLNKQLSLKGIRFDNAYASNMSVTAALDSNTLQGISTISFVATSSQSFSFNIQNSDDNNDDNSVEFKLYDSKGVYLGYSTMESLSVMPGFNKFEKLPTYIDRNPMINGIKYNNSDSIASFLSNFMMGINQKINVLGPISGGLTDNCLNLSVIAVGSDAGDLVLEGMVTSETQQGWTVKNGSNDVTVQGAYSTIKNPLSMPIRVVKTESDLFLQDELQFGYKKSELGFSVLEGNCSATTSFGHLHTGYGMYELEPNKTYVDIAANDIASFFVMAEPQYGQYGYKTGKSSIQKCSIFDGLLTEPYPCCFLFETLAAICSANPTLKKGTTVELDQDFIKMRLESNMTMLIDSKFEITLGYKQDFLPLYFGKEVYEGYYKDLYFTCSDIKFPYVLSE